VSTKAQVRGIYSSKVGRMWPQSPRGIASLMDLNTEADLVLADDVLIVGFEADPVIVREYVPEPLEVDGSGLMYLKVVERWGYTRRNETEFVSAERINQCESFFWIPCTYKGENYFFVPFSWGNRDWLTVSGRPVGMNHKMAKVQMSHFHPWHPTYDGPHEGARITASVENIGLVHRTYADLKRVIQPNELPFYWTNDYCPRFVGHRYMYDVCTGKPARNDLVAHWGDHCELGPIWHGDGWVEFYDAENEEVLQFKPRRMTGAWFFYLRFDHGTSPPVVLYDYGDQSPYASRPRIRALLET
jgi:acetoacetate decarboxylase